ncbi:MAG: hypothetical protein LE169_05725 [Endomicrobium sp.]|nr:hypothetical protein [Endomicrobium sp.]
MKKIICICICISLSSGCGKLLNHGSPVNAVVKDTASEAKPSLPSDTSNASASEPSNTPAPTPEPSKSAQPSDSAVSSSYLSWYGCVPTINVNNSVLYWTLNAVGYAVIAVFCVVVYRLVSPLEGEYIQDYDLSDEDIDVPFEEVGRQGYRICDVAQEDTISYTWYLFKKVTSRGFYQDRETKEELKGIPILMNDNVNAYDNEFECSHLYKPNPAPSQ